ncbi:tetratricopeptide repeat protein [Deinococcus multiflagellatus]|uniref:Tetratricopeptide repeat protein n=1 Tax=Deinococcus multiflagellatus TaxID=1656887 RepID=A0ABW1ZV01_9DEIO
MPFADLLAHLEQLLATATWEAGALHARHAAQQLQTRAEAHLLRRVVEVVPAPVRTSGAWPHALAWVAYRTADEALLQAALKAAPTVWPAFEAFAASLRLDWATTLDWAEQGAGLPGPEGAIAARYRACAQAELGHADWAQAFETALRHTRGRDRGLVRLDFQYYLIRHGQEPAARDMLAAATADFQHDDWAMTLTLANLGISCQRLGELVEAERALRRALQVGARPAGQPQLSTAWRGMGSVYHTQNQPARAEHAFRMAEAKADNPQDRVAAMRSRARVLRDTGRLNEALTLLHDARHHAQLPDDQPHALYTDLAALRVLLGDVVGAQQALALVAGGNTEDRWRVAVVEAACLLTTSPAEAADHLRAAGLADAWAGQEARAFPDLFRAAGIEPHQPDWTGELLTAGPIRAVVGGLEVLLKPTRPEAALLALLVVQGAGWRWKRPWPPWTCRAAMSAPAAKR